MKRLVVCLDGTWNNASREVEKEAGKVYRPTNVLKLARAVRQQSEQGTLQVTYYDAGVGAMNRAPDWRARCIRIVDNILGGGWGAGFEVNIEEAYTFLANNFQPGDQIFVFGFSRGAAQARSLVQLIDWVGGFPAKQDAYYVPRLFTAYLASQARGDALGPYRLSQENSAGGMKIQIHPARIQFLGLWDTVLSLGSRLLAGRPVSKRRHDFHCPPALPACVLYACHALAIDEQRHDFQSEPFEPSERLQQRWFVGTHGNVGGGMSDDGLANIALRWICEEASQAGLDLDPEYLKYYRVNPVAPLKPSPWGYRLADRLLRPLRGYRGIRQPVPERDTLDPSVWKRLGVDHRKYPQMGRAYRPLNLLAYLKRDAAIHSRLPAEVVEWIRQGRVTPNRGDATGQVDLE